MITPTHAADILNYLFDAGATTLGTPNQAQVWADYINSAQGSPNSKPADLLPAARQCIADWERDRRTWKIDVAHYTRALRTLRTNRLAPIGTRDYTPPGLDLITEQAWENSFKERVADGEEIGRAVAITDIEFGVTRHEIEPVRMPTELRALMPPTDSADNPPPTAA